MNLKRKNPYLISYLSLAIVCCIALSVIFFYINYISFRETQTNYYQKKVELLIDDLENQIELIEKTALEISYNNKYQPFYLKQNKYNETLLVNDFEQYGHYCALTEECFLYYEGSDKIFHSDGNTIDLKVYLTRKNLSQEERDEFQSILSVPSNEMPTLTAAGNIYLLQSFKVSDSTQKIWAVLGFVIHHDELGERFQLVSGGMKGNLSLYLSDTLLYSNQKTGCSTEQKGVLTATTDDGSYTICYLPDGDDYLMSGLIPLQLLLVLTDILLVLVIANMFARKSYRPIQAMSDKYRKNVTLSEDIRCENALEEINYMMDSMLKSNMMANMQIEQKQEMLRRQILRMLINGNYSLDVQAYLEKLQIRLPGPYFYVISVTFSHQEDVTEKFLSRLQDELEKISANDELEYVYTICNFEQKHMNVICSITEKERKEELTECVCEVAASFGYEPVVGVGNICQKLTSLSASWLESMDNIHDQLHKQEEPDNSRAQQEYVYDSGELYRISAALINGDETGAEESLNRYTAQLENGPISLLMQQYIFAEFLSEVTRVSKEYHVNLSKQSISLIISAKNVDAFKDASRSLIHDFCEKIKAMQNQAENDKSYQICEYVNNHFAEYDISIEKVAASLNTSAAAVRQAIFKHTGKMYKDYIIYLRIEYAKTLLLKGDLTVAETCQQVGYGSIPYFVQLFKEMTGVTPAKFKNGEHPKK